MANKKLLTLQDLENFYSTRKKSFRFSASDEAEAIVVQVPGTVTFSEDEYDATLGLLPVHLQSCHLGVNRNKSSISEESMKKCLQSIYNRPILGYIHKLSTGEYDFAGHEFNVSNDGDIEYEEIAVGTIPESCNAQLIYDEDKDKTYLEVDGFIYEEYTKAADILRSKKQSKVSVELSLLDFSYDAKSHHLNIDNFYFSGVTILGVTRDGNETPIEEGMYGSNIKLKDFSAENNSMFSNETEEMKEKLIEMQESINTLLSRFNIKDSDESNKTDGKEEQFVESNKEFEEVVEEVTETTDEIVVETTEEVVEETIEETTEESTEEVVAEETSEETTVESTEVTPDVVVTESVEETVVEEVVEAVETETPEVSETFVEDKSDDEEDDDKDDKENFSKTFELSHDDVRCALYQLLAPYEEANNDWYWIVEVFDNHFVYQGCMGNYFGQKYAKENDSVAFDGEPYALYSEFLTESERAALTEMRTNYSAISTELASYKEEEEIADKMTVFSEKAYTSYLETDEFKALMSKETVKQFSKEELVEKADAALGKLVKTSKTFSMKEEKVEEKKPMFFAFAQQTKDTSFLDGLLKK